MPSYVAFLRGVSPMNAKMPEVKKAFETAGFTEVRTLLSSGNVVFDARAASNKTLESRAEKAMQAHLGRTFMTLVRPVDALRKMIEADPYASFDLPKESKRVVTFLLEAPKTTIKLPPELDGARVLAIQGSEVFSSYVPSPRGPAFMVLIEKTYGKDVTTRTWDTVKKCVAAKTPK